RGRARSLRRWSAAAARRPGAGCARPSPPSTRRTRRSGRSPRRRSARRRRSRRCRSSAGTAWIPPRWSQCRTYDARGDPGSTPPPTFPELASNFRTTAGFLTQVRWVGVEGRAMAPEVTAGPLRLSIGDDGALRIGWDEPDWFGPARLIVPDATGDAI